MITDLISRHALFQEMGNYSRKMELEEELLPNWNDAVSLIVSAEEVEAIPIEWLIGIRDIMLLGEQSKPYAQMIENVINYWKKERGEMP